jgi:hypothetical protein
LEYSTAVINEITKEHVEITWKTNDIRGAHSVKELRILIFWEQYLYYEKTLM